MPEPQRSQKLYYWDSCVFLSRFQRTAGRIDIIEKITSAAEDGQVRLLISTYSLSEVVRVSPSKDDEGKEVILTENQIESELALISGYFENDYIIIKPITQVIAEMAREYVAKFGLKPGDAIHVATAIFWDVPVLHTYDDKVLKRTGKICKDGCAPLIIEEPTWTEPPKPPLLLLMEGVSVSESESPTEGTPSDTVDKEAELKPPNGDPESQGPLEDEQPPPAVSADENGKDEEAAESAILTADSSQPTDGKGETSPENFNAPVKEEKGETEKAEQESSVKQSDVLP
jgi:predicted nucleic acid-binding protein